MSDQSDVKSADKKEGQSKGKKRKFEDLENLPNVGFRSRFPHHFPMFHEGYQKAIESVKFTHQQLEHLLAGVSVVDEKELPPSKLSQIIEDCFPVLCLLFQQFKDHRLKQFRHYAAMNAVDEEELPPKEPHATLYGMETALMSCKHETQTSLRLAALKDAYLAFFTVLKWDGLIAEALDEDAIHLIVLE